LRLSLLFWIAHVLSLPIAISYDGYIYLDLADVIGSARFPQDWHPGRTPLYPLALKAAFAVLGKGPLAAIAVSSLFGLGATMLLTFATRRLVGPLWAALVLIILTFYPTFVAFQHFVLTETGTAFFLALLLYLLLWLPHSAGAAWAKTAGLVATLAVGYYWRPAILSTAPFVAILHGIGLYRVQLSGKEAYQPLGWASKGRIAFLGAHLLLVAVVPSLLAKPWAKFGKDTAMMDVTLRQGIIRQALLPPEHPYVGQHRQAYERAIQESYASGNLYSGLRADLHGAMCDRIFPGVSPLSPRQLFFELIRTYPLRYLAGVSRTMALYAGAMALQSENRISREMILSPGWRGAKLGDGPPRIMAKIKEDFQQQTSDGFVLHLLHWLAPIYDAYTIYASLAVFVGLLVGLWLREAPIITLALVPLSFVLPAALVLASIDRYAFPAYPAAFVGGVTVPVLLYRHFRRRSSAPPFEGPEKQSSSAPKN